MTAAVLLLLLAATAAASNDYSKELVRYAVTIDAGSSGSRVHVHHFFHSSEHPAIPRFNPNSLTEKLTPGLSSFEDTPTKAGESIRGLLDFAMRHIPEPKWRGTPVYLKATAGLRSIDEGAAQAILDSCRAVIREFPFLFRPDNALIISGRDEGVYGWVAANYLIDRFTSEAHQPTTGVIEMGGASMQVTFVPSNPVKGAEELEEVRVGDHRFQVYTHSYLNYGLEAVQDLVHESLTGQGLKLNPCYPVGATYRGLTGSGLYGKCLAELRRVVDTSHCIASSCSFNGVFQPKLSTESFFAIENFFYTSEFFGILEEHDPIRVLQAKGQAFCAMDWAAVKAASPDESEDALAKYCFSAAYISTILHDGIGIEHPDDRVEVVRVVNDVAAIDWALGSVILEITNSPELLPAEWFHDSSAVGRSTRLVLVVGTLAVLGVVLHRMRDTLAPVKNPDDYP